VTLTPYEQPASTPAPLQVDPTGGRLVAWAEGLDAAGRLGNALARTAFCPRHFQGKPADAAAAILFGDEIGLSPTQSLRSIYVIGGQPSLYARTMVALVLSHGHRMWTVEDTPSKVTVAGQRRGLDKVEQSTWTLDRARKAGYTSNAKYNTDPQTMLYARAAGDVARRIAPDVLAGIAYTVEEIEAAEPAPTVTVQRADPAQPRTAQRKPLPAPEPPEPELDAAPAASAPDPGEPGVTDPQMKRIAAGMRTAGITDRTEALAFVSDVVGRDVPSRKDLTRHEAGLVIDALERGDAAEPADPDDPVIPDPHDGNDPWATPEPGAES
jgi:hypothetical protein